MIGDKKIIEMTVRTGKDFQKFVRLPLKNKIERSLNIVRLARESYNRIAVACSAGKDSMTVVHLARKVDPEIPVFSVMTPFKPKESFDYLKAMNKKMCLNLDVYFAGKEVPDGLKGLNVILLPELDKRFETYTKEIERYLRMNGIGNIPLLYKIAPSLCCDLLKTSPTKEAVKNLDAWICGLRYTEGQTRQDYLEVEEKRQGLMKINPILIWTENDVWEYMKENDIEPHPWYKRVFPDGRRIRSLGCEPCTVAVYDYQQERDGRWHGTSKCGGECGIHTQILKTSYR